MRHKSKVTARRSGNIIMKRINLLLIVSVNSISWLKLVCRFNNDELSVELEVHVPFKDNGIHIDSVQHESIIQTEVDGAQEIQLGKREHWILDVKKLFPFDVL